MQRETATCEMKGYTMSTLLLKTAAVAAWFTMPLGAGNAQAPATTEDAVFAVASVKPNKSEDQRVIKSEPRWWFTASGHVCWARLEAVSRRPVDR
jgi:hypothetical protein